MRTLTSILLASVLVACGGDGGNNDGNNPPPDGTNPTIDAPPANAMITLSGRAVERSVSGTMAVADATVAAYRLSDEATPVGMTTTDAAGDFSLTIETNGEALDGYLKVTKTGLVTMYMFPPAPVAADLAMIPLNMVSTGTFDALSTIAGANQDPAKGVIAVAVMDGPTTAANPVAGATVASNPASTPIRYNGANGLPSSTATATAADGVAYIFNAPVGTVTVSAMKTGSTFTSHPVKAYAGALTTTLITP